LKKYRCLITLHDGNGVLIARRGEVISANAFVGNLRNTIQYTIDTDEGVHGTALAFELIKTEWPKALEFVAGGGIHMGSDDHCVSLLGARLQTGDAMLLRDWLEKWFRAKESESK